MFLPTSNPTKDLQLDFILLTDKAQDLSALPMVDSQVPWGIVISLQTTTTIRVEW